MSSPDKLTGEKVTNAVNTDDFGGNSTRLDDPGGGSASATSTGNVMDHMGENNIGGGSTNSPSKCTLPLASSASCGAGARELVRGRGSGSEGAKCP